MITLEKTLKEEDLFDSLGHEPEKKHREFFSENKNLDILVEGFEKVLRKDFLNIGNWKKRKEIIESILSGKKFHSREIEDFVVCLPRYEDYRYFGELAGEYLNQCLNNLLDTDIKFEFSSLNHRLPDIGKENYDKNILVKGDVGENLGNCMHGGKIVLHGNAGNLAGSELAGGSIKIFGNTGKDLGNGMSGGLIEVKGNAPMAPGVYMTGGKVVIQGNVGRDAGAYMKGGMIEIRGNIDDCCGIGSVGFWMEGGEIYVYGDAGKEVGEVMEGGSIYLYGKYKLGKKIAGGNIYHKGKLIVKDGKRLGWFH